MKLGLRAHLFGLALAVVVAAAILANWRGRPVFEAHLMSNAQRDLGARATLVAALAESRKASAGDVGSLAQLARELSTEAGASVELLRGDGSVLATSEGQPSRLSRAQEVDVAAVRTAKRGEVVSAFVVEGRVLYSAAPLLLADGSQGVARVGASLAHVDQALATFQTVLVVSAILLLGLLSGVAVLMARFTAQGLAELNQVARRMVDGDLEARSGLEGEEQLPILGRTLDKLARGLSSSLQELRGERDRMAGILEGMQEGVILLDSKRRIVVLNPALREMLLLPADAIGKPLLEVVRNAELRDLFDQAATDDEPTTQEVEIGNIKPRRLLARVARMPGEARQLVAVFVDVTEVRRLESMRRDFVANVSHELRTPVTAIRSAAETLIDGAAADPAASHAFIGIIDRNAQRLQQLVEDLLDLSRIESRGFRLSLEPIDLKPLFSQVMGLFRERAGKKNVALEERCSGELPKVRSDRRALEHVLTNLIDNAVKYCGPGTHVWVNVTTSADFVTVSVGDDGPGIDERHLPRIFERFYRVDAGRSREVGGTGLGLSIVKHLVEAMGGTVSVESKLHHGTTFSFSVKRAEREPEATRAVA
ncbi:MAG: Phosphate regulon sensor protein PhoR [Polyangiaceae bacterium]|nr:Phosphate regulon sensor protein PhoR [Polyangiaceae bacterium]